MHKIFFMTVPGALVLVALGFAKPASAQVNNPPPGLPPAPLPAPGGPPGPYGGIASENFLVTSAANDHGSYLWVVAPVQHLVILCQKLEETKDFSCVSKRLP